MSNYHGTMSCLAATVVFLPSCRQDSGKAPSADEPNPTATAAGTRSLRSSSLSDLANPSIPSELRMRRIRALKMEALSQADREELLQFLEHRPLHESAQMWAPVLNEVMNFLVRTGMEGHLLTPALLALLQDEEAPMILRDYALQHLAHWSNETREFEETFEPDAELRQQSWAFMGGLILDPSLRESSIPATALRVLSYYVQDRRVSGAENPTEGVLTPDLESWLTNAVKSGQGITPTLRARALDAVGLFKWEPLHSSVQALASDGDLEENLRLSAIAALGNYQNPEDLSFFEGLADSDSRLRFAASQALKRHQLSQ